MADTHVALKDANSVPSAIFESSTNAGVIVRGKANESTGRVLVDSGSSAATATTWGSMGNTSTITNASITATSFIGIMTATPANGNWAIVCGSGTATITSSDSESGTLAFTYKVTP